MKEYLDNAFEELKRVDHQIYVSLKYTRTVDVLLNIIKRMIDAYNEILNAILEYAKESGKINEIPPTPIKKGELLKETFTDTRIHENVDLYFLLRKILKASYSRENEYRRHVTLITYIESQEEIINIDIITKYYHFQKDFFTYVVANFKLEEE